MEMRPGTSINKALRNILSNISALLKKRTFRRVVLYTIACALLIPFVIFLTVLSGLFGRIPGKAELEKIRNPLATEIYTADNMLMGRYYIQNRQYLEPEEIPDTLRMALVATEDVRFYKHNGIDFRSLARVVVKSILMGNRNSGGGSTLTQQLVKNLYPRGDFGFMSMPVNKSREMICALRIEKIYNKDQILELYLSTVPFGEDTFGIESASMQFFSKNPRDLKTEESALLVGILKATGTYNPVNNPDNALARRNVVLHQMSRYNYIDETAADSLSELPLIIEYRPLQHDAGIAPYFREYIRGELDRWCSENQDPEGEYYNLYTDGLKVYTTIDSHLQEYAELAVNEHMKYLQGIFDDHWKGKDLWRGISGEQLLINYEGKFSPEMVTEQARRMEVFTWDGPEEREYNTLDSIRHYLGFLQAGFLAMEVATGEVKAWVGGINNRYYKYDHVLATRQTGSVFKPLVYLAALEQGISPCEYFPNDSVVYEEYDDWTPRNADREYGGYYSLKGALINSVNTVSAGLIIKVGIDSVISLAHKAGIESPLPSVPSLALGTGNVSLLEMTGVYQAIANRGIAKKPLYISRIEDKEGNILFESSLPADNGTMICTPENAELMIEMLRGVVERGTAASLRRGYDIDADIAGKTGTTQNYSDGWFIGFTPDLVAGAWVGGDLQNLRFREMGYGQGAFMAMPVWAGFIKSTFRDKQWSYLQEEVFNISEKTKRQLDCDDFREKEPFGSRLLKDLKEKSFFKRLFGKKEKK